MLIMIRNQSRFWLRTVLVWSRVDGKYEIQDYREQLMDVVPSMVIYVRNGGIPGIS